jgi:hypothetical protein
MSNYKYIQQEIFRLVPETCPIVDKVIKDTLASINIEIDKVVLNEDQAESLGCEIEKLLDSAVVLIKEQTVKFRNALSDTTEEKINFEGELDKLQRKYDNLEEEFEDFKKFKY